MNAQREKNNNTVISDMLFWYTYSSCACRIIRKTNAPLGEKEEQGDAQNLQMLIYMYCCKTKCYNLNM